MNGLSTGMARHQAVVRRLSAVEALGSVTVIATDKTGTLTESRMDVRTLDASDMPRALAAMVLANDADLASGGGDPLELGLLRYAEAQGIDTVEMRRTHPVASERPFDSSWRFARVTVEQRGKSVSYLKGAPEIILSRCKLSADDPQQRFISWPSASSSWSIHRDTRRPGHSQTCICIWPFLAALASSSQRRHCRGPLNYWEMPVSLQSSGRSLPAER